jgi:hypothetical protein
MEQHDRSVGKLRPPSLEVVADGIVRVQPIDMKQVHRAIGKVSQRLVEGATEQRRERAEALVVMTAEFR